MNHALDPTLGERLKRKIASAGVVLLVIANVALFMAVRDHLEQAPAVIENEPSAPTSVSAEPPAAVANGVLSLTQSDDGVLARVARGRCTDNGQPRIDLSLDHGKTFKEVALPLLTAPDGTAPGQKVETVRTILQIHIDSPTELSVIASDAKCESRGYATDDGGQSWKQVTSITEWFVDAPGTGVVSPEGDSSEPGCSVVALSPLSDRNAKVLCSDGAVRGTDDDGETWVTLGQLDGATAGIFPGLREGFAVAPDGKCKSRVFVTADAGGKWDDKGCLPPGGTATSLVGAAGRLLVLVGEVVSISTDGGVKWKAQ